MNDQVITEEIAEAEFERWAKAMHLRLDTSRMDEDDEKDFIKHKDNCIFAMMEGRLVVNDRGEFEFTPDNATEALVFREPTGATFQEADRVKSGRDIEKMNVMLGALTKKHASFYAKMALHDYKVAQAIITLFLA